MSNETLNAETFTPAATSFAEKDSRSLAIEFPALTARSFETTVALIAGLLPGATGATAPVGAVGESPPHALTRSAMEVIARQRVNSVRMVLLRESRDERTRWGEWHGGDQMRA